MGYANHTIRTRLSENNVSRGSYLGDVDVSSLSESIAEAVVG